MKLYKLSASFLLAPIIAALLGNLSLGLITAGFTGLLWGVGPGSLFISISTVILMIFTGNINMEIIFIFTFSLAYLIKGEYLFKSIKREYLYGFLFLFSIILIPIWKKVLEFTPVNILNELNISGQLLLVTGLIIFIIKGKFLLESECQFREYLEYLLVFICSVVALQGSVFSIFLWVIGYISLRKIDHLQYREIFGKFLSYRYNSSLLIFLNLFFAAYASSRLLPLGFVSGFAALFFSQFLFRNIKQLPMFELVYMAIFLGMAAGKVGLLV